MKCAKCSVEQPEGQFRVRPDGTGKRYRNRMCRSCEKARPSYIAWLERGEAARAESRAIDELLGLKRKPKPEQSSYVCTSCDRDKPSDQFARQRGLRPYRHGKCRGCEKTVLLRREKVSS